MGAAAARVQVGARGLVDQRLVEGLGEQRLRQVGLGLLAEHRRLRRPRRSWPPASWRPPQPLAHLHRRVAAAGDRALDQQQVALGVDLDHRGAALGDARAAHPAGHLLSLEDAGGVGAGADRAGGADVVGAVGHRAAAEVVALDRALEALADRDGGDLHLLRRARSGDGDLVADLALAARRRSSGASSPSAGSPTVPGNSASRNSTTVFIGPASAFFRWPSSALRQLALLGRDRRRAGPRRSRRGRPCGSR